MCSLSIFESPGRLPLEIEMCQSLVVVAVIQCVPKQPLRIGYHFAVLREFYLLAVLLLVSLARPSSPTLIWVVS
jgi:hypothetical protein